MAIVHTVISLTRALSASIAMILAIAFASIVPEQIRDRARKLVSRAGVEVARIRTEVRWSKFSAVVGSI